MSYIYYHNPKCSKSRAGLELLNNSEISFTIKEYLQVPLTVEEISSILKKLNVPPVQAIRIKEDIFKQLKKDITTCSIEELAQLIVNNPILLERPILVSEQEARVGRPTESLLEII